jgi:hypothetical protein
MLNAKRAVAGAAAGAVTTTEPVTRSPAVRVGSVNAHVPRPAASVALLRSALPPTARRQAGVAPVTTGIASLQGAFAAGGGDTPAPGPAAAGAIAPTAARRQHCRRSTELLSGYVTVSTPFIPAAA